MVIVLLYVVPSVWLASLLALWLQWGLAEAMWHLPPALITVLSDWPMVGVVGGLAINVLGHMAQQWEVMYHHPVYRNLDAIGIYTGAAIVVLACLLNPLWPTWSGVVVGAFITFFHPMLLLYRLMLKRGHTLMTSAGILLVYVLLLAAATYATRLAM
ncbi:MAG: hypothetical protein WAX89_04140 [Alphaproteobacteria bacterium]